MSIEAVIFDMDGLLFNTEYLYLKESRNAGSTLGFEIPDEVVLQCVGTNHERTRAILVENLGPEFPLEEWEVKIHNQVINHLEAEGVEKKEGVEVLLESLKKLDIPLAVASSTRRKNVEGLLKMGAIRDYFSKLVCGDEVSNSKPHPEIFLKAAENLELSPDKCLVFEDSFQGIRAAHAAGMRPVMVPDLKAPDDEISSLCFRILPSLNKAADVLGELLL